MLFTVSIVIVFNALNPMNAKSCDTTWAGFNCSLSKCGYLDPPSTQKDGYHLGI